MYYFLQYIKKETQGMKNIFVRHKRTINPMPYGVLMPHYIRAKRGIIMPCVMFIMEALQTILL